MAPVRAKPSSKSPDLYETSKGVIVPLYNSQEEMEGALDDTSHLKHWNFRGARCDRCGIPNSQVAGLLMQCGICKNAHYCSRKCFNDDLEDHQEHCESATIVHQPVAGPDVRRRGDDDYQETEEQLNTIQKKDTDILKRRAEKEAQAEIVSEPEPSSPQSEEKPKRSWDWNALFGQSDHASTTTEESNDADEESVHSFASEEESTQPANDLGSNELESEPAVTLEVPYLVESVEATPDHEESVEALQTPAPPTDVDDDDEDEDARRHSKQQLVEGYDDEEEMRCRRRVAKILEMDAEHRRKLKVGTGVIPEYHWEPEHVNLSEAELIKRVYGWEVPEWVTRRMLRQTEPVNGVEKTKNFSQTPSWAAQSPLKNLKKKADDAQSAPVVKNIPDWAKKPPLRTKSSDKPPAGVDNPAVPSSSEVPPFEASCDAKPSLVCDVKARTSLDISKPVPKQMDFSAKPVWAIKSPLKPTCKPSDAQNVINARVDSNACKPGEASQPQSAADPSIGQETACPLENDTHSLAKSERVEFDELKAMGTTTANIPSEPSESGVVAVAATSPICNVSTSADHPSVNGNIDFIDRSKLHNTTTGEKVITATDSSSNGSHSGSQSAIAAVGDIVKEQPEATSKDYVHQDTRKVKTGSSAEVAEGISGSLVHGDAGDPVPTSSRNSTPLHMRTSRTSYEARNAISEEFALPKQAKNYSQAPSWIAQPPLKRQPLECKPHTTATKPPAWATLALRKCDDSPSDILPTPTLDEGDSSFRPATEQ
jgi:hypothetical protein